MAQQITTSEAGYRARSRRSVLIVELGVFLVSSEIHTTSDPVARVRGNYYARRVVRESRDKGKANL